MPLDDDQLARAAAFVARLFTVSRRTQRTWRRADTVGKSAGIVGQRLELRSPTPRRPAWSIRRER